MVKKFSILENFCPYVKPIVYNDVEEVNYEKA